MGIPMGIPTGFPQDSYGDSHGDSHRIPMGMGWEWERKFHSHGNRDNIRFKITNSYEKLDISPIVSTIGYYKLC